MGRPLELEDIHSLQLPAEPAISPDGRQVVYVVRTTDADADVDRRALWSVSASPDGGWQSPRQLTTGTADSAPAFSPDGNQLAFLRGGDGPPQLYLLPVAGGEARRVTDLPGGAGAPVWSPAGDRIAFASPVQLGGGTAPSDSAPIHTTRLGYKADGAGLLRDTRQHLHLLDLSTGEVRQLTAGDWQAGRPAWSPDGRRLAYSAGTDPDADVTFRSAPHVLDLAAGGPARRIGPGEGIAGPLVWTADGSALLVSGQPTVTTAHTGLLRTLVDTDAVAPVDLAGPLDRNVMPGGPGYPGGSAQLTADGEHVVFCVRDRGCSHVYVTGVEGTSAPRPLVTGPDVVVSGLSVAARADVVAVVLADPTTYGEVAVVDLSGGSVTRLTAHTATSLPEVELFAPEPRTFTVHDGTEVHGWLLRDPAAPTPAPLLLDVHGGPHNAWHPAADAAHPYHQALAARGWAVLIVNPRASDGYGTEFYTGAVGDWGTGDERDFLEPLDQLVAEGVADPERLALTGYSYGGYMTCWLTGRTDRFAAAIAGGVVADLFSMSGTSDMGHGLGSLEWGDPYTEPETVREHSPLTRVDQVRTPTLILQGLADDRCPVGQAEQWFSALRTRGVPTELVLYPGGSHLFILNGRPSHRVDYSRRILDWTEQHVTTTPDRRPLDAAHWQQRLDELAARHRVPAAGLAVLRLGDGGADELAEAATGVLSKATGVPATTDTVFQIGSISKVWTATLAMQLVDEGRLDLDAPVAEVLPELQLGDPEVAKQVTMRHLLTHTSGIDGDIFTDTGRGDDCVEKYVAALADAPQNHPLGATFSYCNSGFSLAGRVIEVLTGQTWDDALRERVIRPLGLTHTSTLPEEAILHRAAVGHIAEPEEDPHPVPTWLLPRSAGPAGLVNATARDVTSFAALHLRGGVTADGTRLLSPESTAAMQERHAELPDTHSLGDSWGLGWIRFGWDGERLYGHDGNTLGQSAFLRVLPSQGIAVALLTNGGNAKDLFNDLYREVFAEVAGVTMQAPLEPPAQAPDVDLTRYVGTYERSSVTTEVFERDGGLVLRQTATGPVADVAGQATHEYPLVPVSEGLFAMRAPGTESWSAVTFYRLADGAEYVHYGVRANPRKG
jgi:dipeptidyl aminopeptidase/acylaminoacyl peptidase/CubicO group peptidase (beta-lactamase class C family)